LRHLDCIMRRGTLKVANFAGIRCGYKDVFRTHEQLTVSPAQLRLRREFLFCTKGRW
jgi:hypothetical protein